MFFESLFAVILANCLAKFILFTSTLEDTLVFDNFWLFPVDWSDKNFVLLIAEEYMNLSLEHAQYNNSIANVLDKSTFYCCKEKDVIICDNEMNVTVLDRNSTVLSHFHKPNRETDLPGENRIFPHMTANRLWQYNVKDSSNLKNKLPVFRMKDFTGQDINIEKEDVIFRDGHRPACHMEGRNCFPMVQKRVFFGIF